ncbi:hypothetical protein ACRB8A_12645 [Arthrobacter sp. G.S.26]|uniref:hypothetical protein n=1 Tax=Arthrobacter sp. G.S.26 TaxID=3433706 RepID=UPI003D76B835
MTVSRPGQHIRHGNARHLPGGQPQQRVDRAESPGRKRSRAGGHGDADHGGTVRRRAAEGPRERLCQGVPHLVLAMPFEGQERLGQFFPVDAGCNHRQQHPP